MGILEEGIEAEQWLLEEFRKKSIKCFQSDAISLENNSYVLNEIKHQEMFTRGWNDNPPSFDRHGLPIWQVNARMDFWKVTGVRAKLIIKDKETNKIYWQWFDILEAGEHYDTQGNNPRRIYPIDNFEIYGK